MTNLRGPIYFSFLAVVLLIGAYWPQATTQADKEALLIRTMLTGLNQLHFDPRTLDDDFSEDAFDLYLDRLDGSKRFLIQSEVDQLRAYRHLLDDQAKEGDFSFFNLSMDLINQGVERTRSYYQELLAQPFDLEKIETVELDGEKKAFAKDGAELKEYWRKTLKYETVSRLHNRLRKQENKKEKAEEEGEAFEEKSFEEIEAEVREDLLEDYNKWFERIDELRREDRMTTYLNALTNSFDPHTGYYKPKDKEDFDIQLSGSLEGIGARLSTKDEYVKVVEIIPGGPAWKQKELEANDLIVEVAEGDDDPVNLVGMRVDDAVKYIRGKKGTEVRLTVEKPDGTTKIIPIIRDVVIIDENYAKSLLLEHPAVDTKIGYIKLPSFYADFNRKGGPSSGKDVKEELAKLQAEGAEGIILDLRFNSGGSLNDAVKMTGLFFEEGPVVQVKDRTRPPQVHRDRDPEVQFDGPLIVMVNNFSASASEILAAALQDYGRAVIVGSQSTFGKGTVQRFFNLDRALRGHAEQKPLGQVKLTIQKFYRVNGGSTQLKGVVPDIVLPDKYMFLTMGEKENDYPMEWTQINPIDYGQSVTSLHYLDKLQKNSTKRVKNNEVFQKIEQQALYVKSQDDLSSYPLNFDQYEAFKAAEREEKSQFDDMFSEIEEMKISNLEADRDYLELDESRQARNKDWLEGVQKDVYLEETLHIMGDMIALEQEVARGTKE